MQVRVRFLPERLMWILLQGAGSLHVYTVCNQGLPASRCLKRWCLDGHPGLIFFSGNEVARTALHRHPNNYDNAFLIGRHEMLAPIGVLQLYRPSLLQSNLILVKRKAASCLCEMSAACVQLLGCPGWACNVGEILC